MRSKYISILIPTYNNKDYISNLLNSILEQTYKSVEIIIIDDGSTDSTQEVVLQYEKKYEEKGYILKYIWQENQGQSVAINNGLKLVEGEYLAWPDADDFYIDSRALEKMVNTLESNEDAGICYSFANLYDGKNIIGKLEYNNNNIFIDSIYGQNGFYFQPICYMVKSTKLFERIPDREIYTEKNAGQNWQLMLPLFYDTQVIKIPEYLCNIYVRKNSHSRGTYSSVDKKAILINSYNNTLINTINRISMDEEDKKGLIHNINFHYKNILLSHFWRTKSFKEFRRIYKANSYLHTRRNMWNFFVSFFPFFRYIQFSDERIKRIIRK